MKKEKRGMKERELSTKLFEKNMETKMKTVKKRNLETKKKNLASNYNRPSLSRLRLSRITAYLEEKI